MSCVLVVEGANETLNVAEPESLPETEEDLPKSQNLQGFPAQPKPKAIPTHHQRSLVQKVSRRGGIPLALLLTSTETLAWYQGVGPGDI